MAAETSVDGKAIDNAVTRLRNLVTTTTVANFEKLKTFQLQAGPQGMDAAQWLEDVLVDRRHGMIEHVKNLRTVFNGLADALAAVAKGIQTTDSNAAANLDSAAVTALNTWITSVNNAPIPPALGGGHFMRGKTTYERGDTANPVKQLAYDLNAQGGRVGDQIRVPTSSEGLPAPQLADQYGRGVRTDNAPFLTGGSPVVNLSDPADKSSGAK